MKIKPTICGVLLALCAASPVLADKVTDQIALGLEAYNDADYQAAIDELQYAIAQIQSKLDKDNAQLLPDALQGWTAKNVEHNNAAMSMLGGGTHMSRRYSRGSERLEISISANSPMVAGLGAMINNPMLLNSDPNTEAYRYKRTKGIKREERDTIEITLLLAGQILLQLKGERLSDESVIKAYLDAIDFKAVKAALLH